MKLFSAIFLAAIFAISFCARADDTNSVAAKPIADKLKTCPVSGEKFGGDMGEPYVFVYKNQEVKLCCSMCKKEFDKNPDKFLAKIRAADKK